MDKTNKTIQTVCNIGRILSKVVMVCCVVGFAACLLGNIAMLLTDGSRYVIGNLTIHGIAEAKDSISKSTVLAAMIGSMIICASQFVPAREGAKFFEHELALGTPFRTELADELKRLGIVTIVSPLLGIILASTAVKIVAEVCGNVADIDFSNGASVGLGLVMIFIALLLRSASSQMQSDVVEA